jgi:hypothetical protein
MPKLKCIICKNDAVYCVKGTTTAYCAECAVNCFSDIGFLEHIEEGAEKLKKEIDKKTEESD